MSNIVPLSQSHHADLAVTDGFEYTEEVNTHTVPVIVDEIQDLAEELPLFLTKNIHDGSFVCVALLGFSPGENLFLNNGFWSNDALPVAFQRLPFHIGPSDEVCIDTDSPLVQPSGTRIFNEDGTPSSYMQTILHCLSKIKSGRHETQMFIEALQRSELLEPVQVNIEFCNGEQSKLEGLYTVSELALKNLTDKQLGEFNRAGFLGAAFTMNRAAKKLKHLVALKNSQLQT